MKNKNMKNIVFILLLMVGVLGFSQEDKVAPIYDITRPNSKTTAELATMTRMVEGSEAWNTDTNTIWRYVSSTWTDTGETFSTTLKNKLESVETNAKDDQTASEVPFTPNGSIAATDVQTAIQEVRDEAGSGTSDITKTSDYTTLAAITGMVDGDLVYVQADGIAGLFQYDSTLSATDDGGIVKDGWVRQYDGDIWANWFGAVGDWNGTTGNDDTSAFEAALDAAEGGAVFVPKGDYLISSTLKIKQQTALIGEVAGIGAFENRGATIHASSGLTGYMIESVDYGTTDDTYMHGVRIENIQFRSPSISTGRNGIRYTYAGDVSEIKNCKFNGFDIAIGFEEDVSAPFGLDMVSGNINNTSIYNSNTGIYLEKSRAMLNVSNLMTDGVTTPISLYQTGSSLNFNINGWHAENITAGTNLVYVDDCNGRLTINGFDVNDNTNAINVVTIGATQTSNKFNVVINGLRAANASTKIINDLFDIRTLLLSEIGDISSAISYTHNAKNIVDDLTTKSVLKATYSSSMTTPFNVNSPFRLQNTNSTDGNYTILENKDAGGTLNGGILFENENQAANTGKIWFGSRGSGGWSGNTLLIDGDKVGVKNNSPVEALDVTGNIKASGNFLGNSASTTFTAPDGSGNLAATTNTIQELVDEVDGFSLGGGSGDVTLAGDNDFTGANSFEGWTIFRDETGGTGIFSGLAFTQDDGVTTKGAITYSDFGTYPGIQIGNNQSGEEIKLLDAGGLEFDGNIDLTTGHEFRINGIAISGGIQEHPDTGETGIRVGVGTEAEKALATLGASDIWISIDASPMEVETVSSSITLDGFRGADDQTADTASFTVDGAKTGGVYQVIINRATAPTITGSTIMPDTQAFVASTKMSLTFVVNADGSVSHKYAKL